jgi:hypothetical protein
MRGKKYSSSFFVGALILGSVAATKAKAATETAEIETVPLDQVTLVDESTSDVADAAAAHGGFHGGHGGFHGGHGGFHGGHGGFHGGHGGFHGGHHGGFHGGHHGGFHGGHHGGFHGGHHGGFHGGFHGGPVYPAPTCVLYVSPSPIYVGQEFTLSIETSGYVDSAYIDSYAVNYPSGAIVYTANSQGTWVAQGQVSGPGGTGYCSASYTIQ